MVTTDNPHGPNIITSVLKGGREGGGRSREVAPERDTSHPCQPQGMGRGPESRGAGASGRNSPAPTLKLAQ